MSNNYAPCFNRIDFAVIPSYIERPFLDFIVLSERLCILNWVIFSFTKITLPKSMCIIRNTFKIFGNMIMKAVLGNLFMTISVLLKNF